MWNITAPQASDTAVTTVNISVLLRIPMIPNKLFDRTVKEFSRFSDIILFNYLIIRYVFKSMHLISIWDIFYDMILIHILGQFSFHSRLDISAKFFSIHGQKLIKNRATKENYVNPYFELNHVYMAANNMKRL